MANKKPSARRSASSKSLRNERDARLTAVRTALTEYFLGSPATTDKFWSSKNPSLGDKSPANLVKAGQLRIVEQYVTYLKRHARFVKPEFIDQPTDNSFLVFDGTRDEIIEKLREIPANHRIISILFPDVESYYTYAPLFRQIVDRLPEIARRVQRRDQLLFARLLFAFLADVPIAVPKLRVLKQRVQREAARRLAPQGGTMPDLQKIPRRRVPRK